MGVDCHDRRIVEQLANGEVRFAWLNEHRIGHHPLGVEAAQRKHPREHRRDLVDIFGGPFHTFGDEDRVACAIGVGDVVADVVEQQHSFADVAVGEADPARKARLLRDGHPDDAMLGQLLVGEAEEVPVRRGIEAFDSVHHGGVVRAASDPCVRQLAVKPKVAVASPRTPC